MTHNEQTLPRQPYHKPTAHPISLSDTIRLARMVPMDKIVEAAKLPFLTQPIAWADAHSYWDGPLEGLVMIDGKLCLADTFIFDPTNARRSYRAFSLSEANEWWWFDHYTATRRATKWRYGTGAAWFAGMTQKTRPEGLVPAQATPSRETLLGVFMDYDEEIEFSEPLVLWVEALLNLLSTQNPLTVTNRMCQIANDRSESTSKHQRPPYTPILPAHPQIIRTSPKDQTKVQNAPLTAVVHVSSTGLEVIITRVGRQGFLEVSAIREGDKLLWLHGMACERGELEELVMDHKSTIELAQKALIQLGA